MHPLPFLLTLSLALAPAGASDPKPEPAKHDKAKDDHGKKAEPAKADDHGKAAKDDHGKEAKSSKTKAKAEPEAPAPAPAPKPEPPRPDPEKARQARRLADLEVRLKRLENENRKLRLEVTEKVEAAPKVVGSESESPDGALAELRAGNARFVAGARVRSTQAANDAALRGTLAKGQAPFAVIVTCSDSRLADNYIFDQELGRLFTIREAGNSPDLQGLASIEYAVEHLGSKLVMVLGHGGCGAVKAVMESGPRPLPGNLWSLQAAMAGLLESVRHDPNESPMEHLGHLVESNTRRQAQTILERSAIVKHLVDAGKVKVVPAHYDLASGKVTLLSLPAAPKAEAAHH